VYKSKFEGQKQFTVAHAEGRRSVVVCRPAASSFQKTVGTMEDISSVVIDSGTGMIKAGFLGEDAPHSLFPSVTAKSKILKRI
jgi:hypothetical protein